MKAPVTFIMTSCNRFDLLKRTLDSFLALNTYPIKQYIIRDDSGLGNDCIDKIMEKYIRPNNGFNIDISRPLKIGLSSSLSHLMNEVDTEYVFHCEDDWLFEGNSDFIEQSIAILESHPEIYQVWVRDEHDHNHPLKKEVFEVYGAQYKYVTKGFMTDWSGFTWNPGLRRMSDYRKMFPKGYAEFGDEIACSRHANTFGYQAVSLLHAACRHIGGGRHTPDFKV